MKHFCHKICLVVLACFSYLSASAYDFEADGLYFTITSLKDLTVSVDGAVNKDTDKIVIPQTVAYKNKSLTVTSVGDNAFKGYKNLQSVSFPKTVLSIGNSAFEKDSLLTGVVLPDSLLEIESKAFQGCTSLKTIRIPEKVVDLNDNVFWGCSGLISVTLNDSVRTIGDGSFYGTSIKELKLPLSLSDIGAHAFEDSKIREINFPKSLTYIGEKAFMSSELLHVELSKSLLSIGSGAFENTKVRNIDVDVEKIPSECFANCDSLKNIRWTDNVKSIGRDAFRGCQSLDKFTISSSVTDISPSIIWECPNITKLTIGKGLNGLPFCKRVYTVYESYWLRPEQCFATETLTNEYTMVKDITQDKSFLTKLKTVIIEDTNEDFSIRGYYIGEKESGHLLYDAYLPSFSNFDLDYYYVGRPWTDIRSWVVDDKKYRIKHVEKIGHIKKLEIAGMCTENPYFYQDVDTLVLGSNIMSFVVENLYYDSLKTIVCKSTIPPSRMSSSCYPAKIYTDVTLYVPKGCKEAYSNDSGWGTFWDIREFEDDSSTAAVANVIDNQRNITITTQKGSIIVNNAPRNTLVQVYNLQGTLIAKSHEGVINGLSKGAYLITIGAKTFKIVL